MSVFELAGSVETSFETIKRTLPDLERIGKRIPDAVLGLPLVSLLDRPNLLII